MNTDYTAHTLIQKPEGKFVIGYLGKEPDHKNKKYTEDIEGVLDYNHDVDNWLSTAKHFRVKPEDEIVFKELSLILERKKHDGSFNLTEIMAHGINIESIADRVVFKLHCGTLACSTNNKCRDGDNCTGKGWFATLISADKPVEESQSDAVEFLNYVEDNGYTCVWSPTVKSRAWTQGKVLVNGSVFHYDKMHSSGKTDKELYQEFLKRKTK